MFKWICHGHENLLIYNVIAVHLCFVKFNFGAYIKNKPPSSTSTRNMFSSYPLTWAVRLYDDDGVEPDMKFAKHVATEAGLVYRGRVGQLQDTYLFQFLFLSNRSVIVATAMEQVLNTSNDCTIESSNKTREKKCGKTTRRKIQRHCLRKFVEQNLALLLASDYYSDLCKETAKKLVKVIETKLISHPHIVWFERQVPRTRHPRSLEFQDPAFPEQWHLINRKLKHKDINVSDIWHLGITGKGVTVAIIDDGVEWTNPDIHDNYNAAASWDLNDDDGNPMPSEHSDHNRHGTRCAGEIGAVANNFCGVGVAYESKISGIKVLEGPMTDSLEAAAFNIKMELNDIYSCSWGPEDDGRTVDGPHYLASRALLHGIETGRHGYGSIFVVASGNGGMNGDNCNYDGYASSPYTVTIGAIDEYGEMPYYAEECASMLAVTYSNGQAGRPIVTTDVSFNDGAGCTNSHSGTSAAAPLAAGIIALMLQTRPCLTWRDVQYIIAITAQKVDVDHAAWYRNAAGLYHSHKHGFGSMDAWRLVNAAKVWSSVPWQSIYTTEKLEELKPIPLQSKVLKLNYTVTKEMLHGYGLLLLEHVQVKITLKHPHRGDVQVKLICPSGTSSVVGAYRDKDNSTMGFTAWLFSTVRCWGEKPTGIWRILVTDRAVQRNSTGTLVSWQLILYGTPMTAAQFHKRKRLVDDAVSGYYLENNVSLSCQPPQEKYLAFSPIQERILKILTLTGLMIVAMAIYETLEYLCCYKEEKIKTEKLLLREGALTAHSRVFDSGSEVGATETEHLLGEAIPLHSLSPHTVNNFSSD